MEKFPKILFTGSTREAVLDNKRLLLAFKKEISVKEITSILKEWNLVLENAREKNETTKHWLQVNHTNTRFWIKSADGSEITGKDYAAIQRKFGEKLEWIGPVYGALEGGQDNARFCPLPQVLLMEKSEKLKKRQDEIIKKYQLKEVAEKSKYLTRYRYFELKHTDEINAYQLAEMLQENKISTGNIRFENMPMMKPLTAIIPNDTLWADQWNMQQINAPNAWDISTGDASVVICILDEGCDLTHPDLQFAEDGINLGTMMPTGAPTGSHGTACAGIAAATFNNNEGVAGVAGNCLIMPIAFQFWTDVECANGINYATTNGAGVISMSFGVYNGWGWDYATIDPEIQNAFMQDVVMCVATGNENSGVTNRYPGRHPLVIAVGGTDTNDNRKTPLSPDGECWGASFGQDIYDGVTTGVSVVAPCVLCPTTDIQGAGGYNNNGALPGSWACVVYPAQPASGNYVMVFNGTSAATPHVAGLAGLLRSQYPALSNVQIRNIIERTAAKVGTLGYAEVAGFLNGTRNQEMGYGRINAFQSLDFADVMIKDWSGDDGREPSIPPSNNWWSYSDIVVRATDDNLFNPNNPSQSKNVERGQTNYIYVRVTNHGPNEARNVTVDFRITPYIGLEFVYPNDWVLEDGMHVKPTPVTATFTTIPSGGSVIAKFTISDVQTDVLYGWEYMNPWHPCLLAVVQSDNDYAFAASDLSFGNLVLRKNNIAQRNLSVIDIVAGAMRLSASTPFIAGNLANKQDKMFVEVSREKLPAQSKVYLSLDDDGEAFPQVDFHQQKNAPGQKKNTGESTSHQDQWVFLNQTKIKTRLGCCDGILTLEKGSMLELICDKNRLGIRNIKGGNLVVENGKRFIEMTDHKLLVEFEKAPGEIFPMSAKVIFPANVHAGEQYTISVSQRDETGITVGGADTVYNIL